MRGLATYGTDTLKEMTMTVTSLIDGCERCGKWHLTKDHNAVSFANKMQDIGLQKTSLAYMQFICEVCGANDHRTYMCCDACNYDAHVCKLCGDSLGHDEVSACYILDTMGVE